MIPQVFVSAVIEEAEHLKERIIYSEYLNVVRSRIAVHILRTRYYMWYMSLCSCSQSVGYSVDLQFPEMVET